MGKKTLEEIYDLKVGILSDLTRATTCSINHMIWGLVLHIFYCTFGNRKSESTPPIPRCDLQQQSGGSYPPIDGQNQLKPIDAFLIHYCTSQAQIGFHEETSLQGAPRTLFYFTFTLWTLRLNCTNHDRYVQADFCKMEQVHSKQEMPTRIT